MTLGLPDGIVGSQGPQMTKVMGGGKVIVTVRLPRAVPPEEWVWKKGVATCTFDLSTGRLKQVDLCELQASPVNIG